MTPSGDKTSPDGRAGATLQVKSDIPFMAVSFAKYGWVIPSEGACARGSEFVAIVRFVEVPVGVRVDAAKL